MKIFTLVASASVIGLFCPVMAPQSAWAQAAEVKPAEVKAPEVKTPEVKTPEVKAPEVKTPEVKTPEVKAPEVKAPEVKAPEDQKPRYQIKVAPSGVVEIGGVIQVGVFGDFANTITAKLKTEPAAVKCGLKLSLNGVTMPGLIPELRPPEAFGAKTGEPVPALVLMYALDRDASIELNRKAWDTFLSRLPFDTQSVQVGVGLDNDVPHLADPEELQFRVRKLSTIRAVIIVGLILFFGFMAWAICMGMLRESDGASAHSLGKTQMAFWGFLVAFSFLGVWIISGKMERIPSQVLILLGISGTTGLGSVLIGSSKKTTAADKKKELEAANAEDKKTLEPLKVEKTALDADKLAVVAPAAWPEDKAKRLVVVMESIAHLEAKVQERTAAIGVQKDEAEPPKTTGSWLKDIVSDSNGLSFYRLQVVLWTVILGFIFVSTIIKTFTMPEFENTLLVLMGISNGTYLGFKIPEKQGG